jgi:pimeloyl-ACP methyl ester carboxylesterase
MGGKVAIAFAAAHPDEVRALVVEDMDLRTERAASWASAIASVEGEMDRRRHFSANRSFPTWEAAKAALGTFKAGAPGGAGEGAPVAAYGDARIDGWKVDGRVFERKSEREGGGGDSGTITDKSTSKKAWWSGINPLAQYLALRHVLGAVGPSTWQGIARSAFPTYVFVAGRGSACDAASVDEMKALVPRTQVVAFPACGHSIHNDDVGAFMGAIDAVYLNLEAEKKTGGGSACETTGEAAVAKL